MTGNLINLLPHAAVRALRIEYFVRLATVACALGLLVLVAHATLLLPTYLYGEANVRAKQEELDALSASLQTAEERAIEGRLTSLRERATYLSRLATMPVGSALVRELLAVPRPGVLVSSYTLARPANNQPGKMSVSGVAQTRDALRSYVAALDAVPFVASADLPISAYARESDIPFTITLTMTK